MLSIVLARSNDLLAGSSCCLITWDMLAWLQLEDDVRQYTSLLMQVYPDQSLYPANSVPAHVKRINNALQRADQIEHAEGGAKKDWYVPIVADAEAGFGGPLNCFELMKAMIEAGAAGVHFEDQLASEKKCGHLGGKVKV